MKTIDYVKKYKLNENDQFSHKYFAIDFGNDFMARLEVYKLFSSWSLTKFFDLVAEMQNKWNQIDKKTAGQLPEKLWYYIYNNILIPTVDVEFPEVYAFKQQISNYNADELKTVLKSRIDCSLIFYMEWEWDHKYTDNSIGQLGLKPNYDAEKVLQIVKQKNDYLTWYVYDELTYQLKKMGAAKAKLQFKIHITERQRRTKLFDWFEFIAQQHLKINQNEFTAYFSVFGLDINTATEKDVKSKFRDMLHILHPDKPENRTPEKKERLIEVTEAKNKCTQYFAMMQK